MVFPILSKFGLKSRNFLKTELLKMLSPTLFTHGGLMYVVGMANENQPHRRNKALFDNWSIFHLCIGTVLGWIMTPFIALVVMTLWEPLEIFVLSPVLARFGIIFGHESLQNSLSDIFFNTVGVTLGAFVLGEVVTSPITIF